MKIKALQSMPALPVTIQALHGVNDLDTPGVK